MFGARAKPVAELCRRGHVRVPWSARASHDLTLREVRGLIRENCGSAILWDLELFSACSAPTDSGLKESVQLLVRAHALLGHDSTRGCGLPQVERAGCGAHFTSMFINQNVLAVYHWDRHNAGLRVFAEFGDFSLAT